MNEIKRTYISNHFHIVTEALRKAISGILRNRVVIVAARIKVELEVLKVVGQVEDILIIHAQNLGHRLVRWAGVRRLIRSRSRRWTWIVAHIKRECDAGAGESQDGKGRIMHIDGSATVRTSCSRGCFLSSL